MNKKGSYFTGTVGTTSFERVDSMKEILTEIVVQPEDIDELGHMNYLRYLTYFEKGELDWFARIGVSEEYFITRDIGAVLRKFD